MDFGTKTRNNVDSSGREVQQKNGNQMFCLSEVSFSLTNEESRGRAFNFASCENNKILLKKNVPRYEVALRNVIVKEV